MSEPAERRPGFESPFPTAVSQVSRTGWRLVDHILWRGYTRTGEPFDVEAPPGTDTDLGSTPGVLWALFPPYGDYTAAVIIHDRLWRGFAKLGAMSYAEADYQLREMLRASGVPWLRRWTMWAAVRWGALLTRRGGHKGWLRDAPAVLGVSLLALPYVALPVVVNGLHMMAFNLTEALISTVAPSTRGTRPSTKPAGHPSNVNKESP